MLIAWSVSSPPLENDPLCFIFVPLTCATFAAIIPDSVRRGLMDALREHLKVLGLHWLASVKDAVRLNQVQWYLVFISQVCF